MKSLIQRRTLLLVTALGAGTSLLQACGGGDSEPERNIVQKAQANPDLSILVEAVVAAGLVDTLSTGSFMPGVSTISTPASSGRGSASSLLSTSGV